MYTDQWWEDYKNWYEETYAAHEDITDLVESHLRGVESYCDVLDLGCGRLRFGKRFCWGHYTGVDLDPQAGSGLQAFIQGDFNTFNYEAFFSKRDKTLAVSLFATELYCAQPTKLYRKILDAGAVAIVAAGVRYGGTKVDDPVGEPGARVWQTSLEQFHPELDETIITKHVPSKMFGQNVWEVWRVIKRK